MKNKIKAFKISALILVVALTGCKKNMDRLTGMEPDKPTEASQGPRLVTVSCCRDNNNGILTYPAFVPAAHAQYCQSIRGSGVSDGVLYFPMNVDCGNGHHDVGDEYYDGHNY